MIMFSFLIKLSILLLEFAFLEKVYSEILPCDAQDTILFQCADQKTCINRQSFCNSTSECPDGSDELAFNASIASEGTACQYRRDDLVDKTCLLPKEYQCDHELDCADGKDECNCDHTFNCADGDCVVKVSFCDGIQDCADNTDENKFNRTTKIGFQCPVTRTHVTNNCVLPDEYVCDGDSDCDNGIDECFCEFTWGIKKGRYLNHSYSNDKCFRCLDGSLVMPNIYVCDGVVHCEDLSDECLCPPQINETKIDICDQVCSDDSCNCVGNLECFPKNQNGSQGKICINSQSICDNVFDCENGSDEKFCADDHQTFECHDKRKKIRRSYLCDGPEDCDDGSDELHCATLKDHYCYAYRRFFPDVVDWENVPEGAAVIPKGRRVGFDYPFKANKCDGVPMCGTLSDECYANCSRRPGYCDFISGEGESFRCPVSGSLIIGKEICDGKPTCNDTTPEISEDELFCPERFYCNNKGETRLPIHVPESSRCNQIQECDDQSDEIGCGTLTHYYCEDDGTKLFISRKQVCDGKQDCISGSDECQNCNPSPFSSDKKLIKSRVLIVFLWIIGLVAVVGNLAVIFHQAKNLIKPEGRPGQVVICNRTLVLNLSLADILVGIYLVSLGIKDASVNEYCIEQQEWRTSTTCNALGSIALIGTETSVFILLIMTAYRLYLVVKPFKTERLYVVKFTAIGAWSLSMLLAFLPFSPSLKDYFISAVWYRHNPFIGYAPRSDLSDFVSDLVKHDGPSTNFTDIMKNGDTWDNMFQAVKVLNTSYTPERYFGYYSAHSVCLPRLFPDPIQDPSWGYSLFIIVLNFSAFICILLTYFYIYRKTTQTTAIKKQSQEERASVLQRKISRIVLTDFCCWMPICITAFVRLSGVYVPEDAYAVTAIILLPINAAMNPFLYSDILEIIWKKILPFRQRLARSCGCAMQEAPKTEPQKPKAVDTDTGRTRETGLNGSHSAEKSLENIAINGEEEDTRI